MLLLLLLLLPLPPCPDLRRGEEGGVTAAMPGLERRERRRGVLLLPLCPDSRRGGEEGEKKLLAAAAVPGVKKRERRGREGIQLLLLPLPCPYLRRGGGEDMLQRDPERVQHWFDVS